MQPLTVDAALLRAQLAEITLRVGSVLPARVLEKQGTVGVLLLAGVPLAAELPDEIEPGARLRLRIADLSAQRVELRVVDQVAGPPPPPAPVAPRVPLPGPGGRDASAAFAREDDAILVRFESPELGPIDLRITLADAATHVSVRTDPGEPFVLAREAAPELRGALRGPSEVSVSSRPLERYA